MAREKFVVDHMRVLRNKVAFRRAWQRILKASREREDLNIQVLHEADDQCCRREPWAKTSERLLAEVMQDTPDDFVVTAGKRV